MKALAASIVSLNLMGLFAVSGLAQGVSQGNTAAVPYRDGEVAVVTTPENLAGFDIVKFLPNAGITVVAVPVGQESTHVQLFELAGETASLNYVLNAFASVNDPLRSFQWHFDTVQANAAWDISTGAGVTVAVLDSGYGGSGVVDGLNCTTSGTDIVNNDNDPTDGDGHGTHVCGTVAGASNNNTGVAGLAHGACVMPVKVLNDSGSGTSADIADGIIYAVNNGADVINMSLGFNARFGITNDTFIDPALDHAYNNDVTVVCASGNDSRNQNVSYPAIYPTTIGVGATDFINASPRYSNGGTGLDIVAPGGDLAKDRNGDGFGDGVLQETQVSGSWGYWFFDGTSMASPHVAAVAAMVIANGNASTPDEVYEALTCSALDLGSSGYDSEFGHGLLQAEAALNYVLGNCGGGNNCTDADGDGVCVEDGDCDDNDPDVFPGANDTRGRKGRDGIDNDCNGIIDG